jgi:hypothetical protein
MRCLPEIASQPCRRTSRCTLRRVLPIAGGLLLAACGDPDTTTPPGTKLGGTLSGRYLLELKLGPSCGATAVSATFPVLVATGGSSPHPGIQVTVDGSDPGLLELELKYTDYVLEGGFGTTDDGAVSQQATSAWVNGIGSGQVTRTADGHGQVTAGTLRGYLEVEGANPCIGRDHVFTLKPR